MKRFIITDGKKFIKRMWYGYIITDEENADAFNLKAAKRLEKRFNDELIALKLDPKWWTVEDYRISKK